MNHHEDLFHEICLADKYWTSVFTGENLALVSGHQIMLILFLLSLQIERYISFLLSEHFVCFHYSETSVVVNSILKHITRVYDIMEEGVLMVETRVAIYCCLVPTTCSSLAQNTEHWPPIARQWTPHPSCNRT